MPLCVALAVREMGMTPAEAVHAATRGGARGAATATTSARSPPAAGPTSVLDAPSHVHLAYRPGVPLVARVWVGGRPVVTAPPVTRVHADSGR